MVTNVFSYPTHYAYKQAVIRRQMYEDLYNKPFVYQAPPKITPSVARMQLRLTEAIEEAEWEEVWDLRDSLGRHGFY